MAEFLRAIGAEGAVASSRFRRRRITAPRNSRNSRNSHERRFSHDRDKSSPHKIIGAVLLILVVMPMGTALTLVASGHFFERMHGNALRPAPIMPPPSTRQPPPPGAAHVHEHHDRKEHEHEHDHAAAKDRQGNATHTRRRR